jgi:hypothetical protein
VVAVITEDGCELLVTVLWLHAICEAKVCWVDWEVEEWSRHSLQVVTASKTF